MIDVFGIAPCFYINAASYIAVITALSMMDTSLLHRLPTVERAKGQLREGLRYAWSERMVRTPLLMMAVIGTLAFNFQVVIPLIATKTFGTERGRHRRPPVDHGRGRGARRPVGGVAARRVVPRA